MNQGAPGDVVLATQVHPAHPAGIVKVGKTSPGRESRSAGGRRGGAPEPATDWSPPRRKSASASPCRAPCPIIQPKHSHLKMFRRLYPRAARPGFAFWVADQPIQCRLRSMPRGLGAHRRGGRKHPAPKMYARGQNMSRSDNWILRGLRVPLKAPTLALICWPAGLKRKLVS
jgi:hypothetical protein